MKNDLSMRGSRETAKSAKQCVAILAIYLLLTVTPFAVADTDYRLEPVEVAPGTYVLLGQNAHFTFANACNIVNTGFIVTDDGVLVIDSGPSRLYGEQLRAAIARVTDKPIVRVLNTHLHPDHFLGNQAFADLPVSALPKTVSGIGRHGEGFNDSMYRLCGAAMKGTYVLAPSEPVEPGILEIGGHRLRLMALEGHTDADLVVLDETTGVLFAGDLVFNQRTPTTPHARISVWRASLQALSEMEFKVLVPGHGPVTDDASAIEQTDAYLVWLDAHLLDAAESGHSMAEVLHPEAPAEVERLAVFADEYQRSVEHLYPTMEFDALSKGYVEQTLD